MKTAKKSLALILAFLMLFATVLPASAIELVPVESVEEPVLLPSEDDGAATLAAAGWFKPGLNAINDKTTVETFEDMTTIPSSIGYDSNMSSAALIQADKTFGGVPASKVIAFSCNKATGSDYYPQIVLYCQMEPDRLYYLAFDIASDNQTTVGQYLWFLDLKGTVVTNSSDEYGAAVTKGGWFSYSNRAYSWSHPKNPIVSSPQFVMQSKRDKTHGNITWYLDNVMLMPYYKVTYMNLNGTVADTEQLLFDEDGGYATIYTPKSDNYPTGIAGATCLGWSTEQDAEVPMTEIPLQNADIVLYPVWEYSERSVIAANSMSAVSGTKMTVTAGDTVTWTVDVGTTEATYTTTDTTVEITAAGYAGEVTVEALFPGDTVPVTKVVKLYGGTKWKPGLNTLTGTEKPFDFECTEAEIFSSAVSGSDREPYWFKTKNPVVSSANDTMGVVYTKRQYDILRPKNNWETSIEVGRPLDFQFDILSSNAVYIMVNGAGGGATGNIYSSTYGANATSAWKHEHIKMDIANDKTESNLKDNNAKDGIVYLGISGKTGTYGDSFEKAYIYIDNYSFIPYYKITYIGADGEVAAVDYALYDEAGNILKEYKPNLSLVEGATAVSLEPDGELIGGAIPLENKDLTLYVNTVPQYYVADVDTFIPLDGEDCVIPDPKDLGIESADFRVWLDDEGTHLYPGEVYPVSEMKGKTLTGYYQDVTKPAMGYAYEGNEKPYAASKGSYYEIMEDDGRNVLHINQYASTWTGSEYKNDMRLHFRTASAVDANEYNIVQYMYKIPSAVNIKSRKLAPEQVTPEDLEETASTKMITFYYTSSANDGYYTPGGEHRVGYYTDEHVLPVDNDYHLFEMDMSVPANNNPNHPWNATGKFYGLALDPNRVYFAGDSYIDYLRVYRDGIFTVNYDTNLPAELADYAAEVVKKEVEPDTGRGAGVGYLLKGERPVVDSLLFRGWGLTPDATPDEAVDSIDLVGDTTVYAIWEEDWILAPEPVTSVNIRSGKDGVNGIRFRATVDVDTREMVHEYGFLVARTDVLEAKNAELTFDFKEDGKNKPLYTYGAAYIKGELDKQYAIDDYGTVMYSAVCVGVPDTHLKTPLTARPYIKYANKNGLDFTLYGESVSASIYDVAKDIKENSPEAYEANKAYIDKVLGE